MNKNLSLFFVGWCFSRFVLSIVRVDDFYSFSIVPGYLIGFCVLFLFTATLYLPRVGEKRNSIFWVALGVLSDSLFYSILRPGSALDTGGYSSFSAEMFVMSVLSALGVLVLLLVTKTFCRTRQSLSLGQRSLWLIVLLSFIIPIFFRVQHIFTQHLPNECRSLFVLGFEIHHGVQGLLILIVLVTLYVAEIYFPTYLWVLGLSVAAGMMLDQASYLMLARVTDVAYSGMFSVFGAAFSMSLFYGFCVYINRATRKNNDCKEQT